MAGAKRERKAKVEEPADPNYGKNPYCEEDCDLCHGQAGWVEGKMWVHCPNEIWMTEAEQYAWSEERRIAMNNWRVANPGRSYEEALKTCREIRESVTEA